MLASSRSSSKSTCYEWSDAERIQLKASKASVSSDLNRFIIREKRDPLSNDNVTHAFVYESDGSNWTQTKVHGTNSSDESDPVMISKDGSRIGVYALNRFIKIYDYNGTDWSQAGRSIFADNVNEASIALSGDGSYLVVANSNCEYYCWTSYVNITIYFFNGTDFAITDIVEEEGRMEDYGLSVAMSNDGFRLAVTRPSKRLFRADLTICDRNGSDWLFRKRFYIPHENTGKILEMSDDGNRIIVGTAKRFVSKAHVYDYDGTQWIRIGGDVKGKKWADATISGSGNFIAVEHVVVNLTHSASKYLVYEYESKGVMKLAYRDTKKVHVRNASNDLTKIEVYVQSYFRSFHCIFEQVSIHYSST